MSNHGVHWLRGELIGEGSFGSVYLATTKKPRRGQSCGMLNFPPVIAVKSAKVSASESIQHEAKVLSKIKGCPSVIECFGEETTTTEKGDMVYNLLLEYASGGTLDDLIKRSNGHGLAETDVKKYTKSILEGIKHIHTCGYVHSDLKPENILFVATTTSCGGTTFVAKIADFGLAKKTEGTYSRLRGTPRYMSLEAFIDNKQDQSSDIWSLGCIVFEMLTGKSPWDLKPGCDRKDFLDVKMFDHLRTSKIPAKISDTARGFLKSCLTMRSCERLSAQSLLSHPFLTQPQPGCAKAKVINSILGYTYGCVKPGADFHGNSGIVPRIQPFRGCGIPARV